MRRARNTHGGSLDFLFALPRFAEAPPIALILIANAVDLLQRFPVPGGDACISLLFEPYSADQFRKIVQSHPSVSSSTRKMNPIDVELRIRQVAKQSGDCRQVMALCEQAAFESKTSPQSAHTPLGLPSHRNSSNGALLGIEQLPLEHHILLSVFAGAKSEVMPVSKVFFHYKELCKKLHQPDLASKGQVNAALDVLEQRGLIGIQTKGGSTRGRPSKSTETYIELAYSYELIRQSIVKASPPLAICFS